MSCHRQFKNHVRSHYFRNDSNTLSPSLLGK
ncbi:hypothetical protein D917_06113 [Trichinella nativa]|uniref:Uncharacterized protein n=1 Tax=Trichinella nativa TaxID=6335 RepID=A0A1Y3ETP7_9BILA|nr:hypothetical protein D917_06113 [Trichinella nativa]